MNERSKGKVDDPLLDNFLKARILPFLRSLMKDSSPHATPTWVDIKNGNTLENR
jgi:hypothetical protein